jgi:ATP-dependent DNA ligase
MLCQTANLKDLERSGFIGEEKYDGTRVLIIKYPDGKVKLQNRHGIDYTYRLTELVEAAKMIRAESFILDGEAVYRDPATGKVDFQPCQRRCSTQDIGAQMFLRQKYPLNFMAFDILLLNQQWQIDKPLLERKQILRNLLPHGVPTLEYVPYRYDLRAFFEEVKARGDEGLIIKRVDSKYRQGERSYDWQKVKNCEPKAI